MAGQRSLEPASLHWQEDGELAAQDLFALVCRLRDVEPAEHSNELWRLGHKSPATSARTTAEPGESAGAGRSHGGSAPREGAGPD